MDMLCIAAEAQPTGYVLVNGRTLTTTDLVRLTGAPEADVQSALAELDAAGVFSRDSKGRIYSRRMLRDMKASLEFKKNGKEGGNPDIRRGTVPKSQRVRPYRRTDSPAKTQRIFKKSGGRCHWCNVPLVWQSDELRPDLFHVDHLQAVCDGGTNDERNLVAACAKCNHARARNDWVNASDTKADNNPDTKPHYPSSITTNTPQTPQGGPSRKRIGEGESSPVIDVPWEQRCRGWAKGYRWDPFWGPAPNEPGCYAPAELAAAARERKKRAA